MAKQNVLAKAEAHANAGRVEEASKICRSILKKTPKHMEAMFLLSGILMLEKKFQESEPLLRKVLAHNPEHVSAMNNLGVVYREHYKDLQMAESLFKKVIAANPAHFRALMNLGNIYCDQNRDALGAACYEQALAVNPGAKESATFLSYLGNISYRMGKFDEAIAHFERALTFSPDNPDILRNFLLARFGKGNKPEMVAMMEDLLKLPDAGRANFPIFSLAKRNCLWEMVEKTSEKVVTLARAGLADYSALQMSNLDLLAMPGVPYQDLLDVHRITGEILEAKRMRSPYTTHEQANHTSSRMKIAYLSGDFRGHVINTFIRGLFNFHDRERFEIYCYSNTLIEDKTTEQYKKAADVFINVTGMTDAELAEKIHADGVHVLVNLAGYTKDSRIEVMAYRAAPVQIMYLGYPYTSGLSTVDYFISDPYLDGPENARYFVEKQLRLPECFATFERLYDQEISHNPPFKANGHVTFGCLVNPYKLTPEVVAVWSNIMRAVPDSRIILNNPHYDFDLMREKITDAFSAEGVDASRVKIIHEKHSSGVHLRYYNDIDIALDTFPLTGGTTTHEALWMGVPVVTLVGDIYPHRLSYTILSNAGMDLSELIAFSKEEYVAKVLALANNSAGIEALHREIPVHLKKSIQCDPVRHTQHMEAAYIEAWRRKFPDQSDFIERASASLTEETAATLLEKAASAIREGHQNQAKTLCRKVFKIDPENLEALNLLGSVHLMEKKYDAAKECFELVVSVLPDQISALNNLGLVYHDGDRDFKAAETCFKKVLQLQPRHINGLMNLGNLYRAMHQIDAAQIYYKKALALTPENGQLLNNIGSLYAKAGQFSEARDAYQKALMYLPGKAEILSNLLTMHRALGDHDRALDLLQKVSSLPKAGAAHFPAYHFSKVCCLWDEASTLLPKVEALIQDGQTTLDGFIEINLSLLATPGISDATHFEIHKTSGAHIEQLREGPVYSDYFQPMQRTGRLKIAYLSPDFHEHVSNISFRGLMNFHDRELFEITCYSNANVEDAVSAQYRATADHFFNVSQLSDRALADKIHDDGIHFLIDLAGYTSQGRMAVFAYRPAPVQIMYLGYPYTSGLSCVDYFISDPFLDGDKNASYFTEKQLRLPQSFMSFGYLSELPTFDAVMPCEKNGVVTFGSMNNPYKLNPEVIRVWSDILKVVPDSRMIINHPNCRQEITQSRIIQAFEKQGIASERIRIISETHPAGSHFHHYREMDIILDSFPLTGGTTTIDALWMGIPVITKVGEIYPHRLSYSILKNVGINLEELIAFSDEEYIRKAVALAKQPLRIASLHRDITVALRQSILTDPLRLTRQMEAAYLQGWNKKYPNQAIARAIKSDKVRYIPLDEGLEIAVPDSLENLESYLLTEQKGGLDPEYRFVQHLVQKQMHVLDFCAGIGTYAVPLSQKLGHQGKLWAVTASATDAQYLYYSKGKNALDALHVIAGSTEWIALDEPPFGQDFSKIGFMRIGAVEGLGTLLSKSNSFLKTHAPIIMFRIKGEESPNPAALVEGFKSLGYDVYRHVPGPNLLVPTVSAEELDTFTLNLFACKTKQAEVLETQGRLIRRIDAITELPGLEHDFWQVYMRSFPYAKDLMSAWVDLPSKLTSWENYWIALNLYAQSQDVKRSAGARYAALNTSFGLLVMLAETAVNLPRILTLIRVMIDLGKRENAVHFLNQVVSLFESGDPVEINEPFLPLSDESALIDPGNRFAEWLFASVLMQREKSRAFSTYFSGESSVPIFEAIRETSFYSEEAERQLALIRLRFPGCQEIKTIQHGVSVC